MGQFLSGASNYGAAALAELFDFEKIESKEELVLSALLATHYGQSVPIVLIKEAGEVVLKSWKDHALAELVVGRNLYQGLLRSVTHGYVEFPLPREVLASLPDFYLLDVGAERVLRALFLLSGYVPVVVEYNPGLKGVFLRCQVRSQEDRQTFGGMALLPFPEGLADVTVVVFKVTGCLNANHPGVRLVRDLAEKIIQKEGEKMRAAVESSMMEVLGEAGWEWKRMGIMEEPDADRGLRRMRERLAGRWDPAGEIGVDSEKLVALMEARVIRDELWSVEL